MICLIVFLLFLSLSSAATTTAEEEFILDTTGNVVHQFVELDEVLCTFTYDAKLKKRDVVEKWKITLAKLKRGDNNNSTYYSCDIESSRKNSKAVFEMFSASFEYLTIETAEVFSNNGALLENDDFIIEDNAIMNYDNFKNSIAAIHMTGTSE